jgi:hypothetical protein
LRYRISGLSPEPFQPLFQMSDRELAGRGIIRLNVDASPGYPDRITLREVPVGETVLLLNHVSLDVSSPYRASHAIFVWEGAVTRYDEVGRVPEVMRRRLLSLRAFDRSGMMQAADVVEGAGIEALIDHMFADASVAMIHVHNARQGCFAGQIVRG